MGSSLPWSRIYDYLYEIGSQPNLDEFCHKALEKIDYLIPIEDSVAFLSIKNDPRLICDPKQIERLPYWELRELSYPNVPYINKGIGFFSEEIDAYNQYYGAIAPWFKFDKVIMVNWDDYDTEFVMDYVFPKGVGQSIIAYIYRPGSLPGTLCINFPRYSLSFSDQNKTILEFIQPHLSNYYSIFSKMDQLTSEHFHAGELIRDFKLLSKREAEVATLLCEQLTMAEIATKLLISPRTVHTYVENIKKKLGVRNKRELMGKLIGICPDKLPGSRRENNQSVNFQ